jgi:ribonuclease R
MVSRKKKPQVADPYREREQAKYAHPVPSREFILELLRERGRPMDRADVAAALELEDPEALEGLRRRLRAMERDGQVIRNRRGGYVIVDNKELVRGRVTGQPDGWGFVLSDVGMRKIYLSPRQMRVLLHGDRVVVRVTGADSEGRPEGELVEVIKRQNTHIVGRFFIESGVGFVVPESRRIQHDVIVPADQFTPEQNGQLVVAELLEHPSERRQPIGRIVKVLGAHIEPGMEIEVARQVHGIPTEWPEQVLSEVAGLGEEVPEEAKQGRVDLRNVPLVTIDGPDARDFDDAVFCEPTASGWRLIVAIADVSHYVRPRTALDREATERGNSVYFPRAVVPMLPEVLSNGLCSLKPKVDRLCMCCEMHISPTGALRRSKFFSGLMRSHARLTYDEVAAMLDGDAALSDQYSELLPHLHNLHGIYKALRIAREKRGAVDFETTEAKLVFDEQGAIERIVPVERNDAHRLIEECMVVANVAAARFLLRHRALALYRDHEGPEEDRLDNLRQFLGELGLQLTGGDSPKSRDYAKLMKKVQDRPDRHLIQTVLLRSLKAAQYRPENVGHFGLALDAYAHFTSPIRRYPDLLVHRAIRHVTEHGTAEGYAASKDEMVMAGEHCSMTERRADEATRDAIMTLKCQYMSDKLGQEFEGIISGVTSFGLFVELSDVYVDGLVHITNLENDFFHFDPIGHRLSGERSGKQYRLGDRVVVKVARVDKDERQIDFEMIAHEAHARGGKPAQMKPVERRDAQRAGRRRGGKHGGRERRRH